MLTGKEKQTAFSNNLKNKLYEKKGFIDSKLSARSNLCNDFKVEYLVNNIKEDIDRFKNKFKNIELKVYLAPLIKCNYKYEKYTDIYKEIIDNEVYYIDEKYFNDFSHLSPRGAELNTDQIARWFLQ